MASTTPGVRKAKSFWYSGLTARTITEGGQVAGLAHTLASPSSHAEKKSSARCVINVSCVQVPASSLTAPNSKPRRL